MRDWRTELLERIAEIRSSNVDKKTNPAEEPVRLCNYMDVYSREYITEDIDFMEATATPSEIQRFGIERGDVLITKDSETPDDIGIPTFVVDDIPKLVCGYHVALIKPNRAEVDPLYLAKQLGLSGTARYYGRLANGSTRYGLSYQSIARTPIRLAPLPQQQRIAEILSTVDEAIEQTEVLIAKTQQIKAGLMHDLFTRGVTADGQLRPPREEAPQLYKESPLGWIPKEWEVETLDQIRVPRQTITYGVLKPGPFVENGIPLLQIEDVIHGALDFAKVHRISAKLDAEYSRTRVNGGEIVISLVGTIGRVAHLPRPIELSNLHRNLGLIAIAEDEIPRFFFYYLQSWACTRLLAQTTLGSTQALLNLGSLRVLPTPVPTRRERQRIADALDAVSVAQEDGANELRKLQQIRAALMQDLLSGRVHVAVERAPEPNEVAASV